VLDALTRLCRSDPAAARETLGLSVGLAAEVDRDAALDTAPTARADRVYSGVLFAALGLSSLDAAARRRAAAWTVITSGLFGVVRLGDPVPAYRLGGQVRLPGVGPVAAVWREVLGTALPSLAGRGPVLDLRSTTYAAFWRPVGTLAQRTLRVRVQQDLGGSRPVVSHLNKATKGRLLRSLLHSGDTPRSLESLVSRLEELGWRLERRTANDVDVVVTEL
jgi:cytoplasmic iron level regulating protein YaaA (DUF328/UPF0246 family)